MDNQESPGPKRTHGRHTNNRGLKAARAHEFRMRLLDTVADVVKLGLAGTVIVLVAWFVRGQKTTLTLSGVNSAVVTGVVAGPFLFLWRRAAKKNSQQTGELRKLRIRTDRWELEALARKQGSESDETESDDPKEGSNES